MELDPTSQAQLTAFLLSQSQPPPHEIAQHELSTSSTSSPFDPAATLATLPWSTGAGEMGTEELDNWLKLQMDALNQLPPSLPQTQTNGNGNGFEAGIPAQPDAFPPISNNRFHPYDRQSKSTGSNPSQDRTRWQQTQQQTPFQPIYQPPLPVPPPPPPSKARRQPVLYPPENISHPLILSSPLPPPHLPTPAQTSSVATPSPDQPHQARQGEVRRRTRRSRSLPSFPTSSSDNRDEEMDRLREWMDTRRLRVGDLLTGLNDSPSSSSSSSSKINEFLGLAPTDGLEARLKAWRAEKGIPEEKGMEEVVREWEELENGVRERERLREREKGMEDAVKELRLGVGGKKGPVAGVVIRSVINRYHESYAQSSSDLLRLDAALSRPPSPNLSSAPREPTAWSGHLVIAPLQADLLGGWLMAEGRPNIQEERNKGGIETEHMRIYSSLSPLDLHARGAEICRALLSRDPSLAPYYPHFDHFHQFVSGPQLALVDTIGFSQTYDDYSLWHHSLMIYLQLCVRYPSFRDSKNAEIFIAPDLPPPTNPTMLEKQLIDRLLKSHWEYLRLYLLNEHGGLLRSAVRGFEGVKLSRFDLLSVVSDTIEVIEALKKSASSTDRILPYDPSVSQVRNEWRQRAFWDSQSHWVVWSAATTHFLELSSVEKSWSLGVGELPGLDQVFGH